MMKGDVPWVVVLRSCAERHLVDIDYKDCDALADELVRRGKLVKEKDAVLDGMKAENMRLSAEISRLTQRNIDLCGELDTITEKVYKETWDKAAGELQRKDAEIARLQAVMETKDKEYYCLQEIAVKKEEEVVSLRSENKRLLHDLIQAKDRLKFTSDCKGSCEGCRYAKKGGAEWQNPMHYCLNGCGRYLHYRGFCTKKCHDKYYDKMEGKR